MRPVWLSRPFLKLPPARYAKAATPTLHAVNLVRAFAQSAPRTLSTTTSALKDGSQDSPKSKSNKKRKVYQSRAQKKEPSDRYMIHSPVLVDHRAIGTAQSLFTNHPSSPGAPFFQPHGTHIFQKLVSFLRAQYPHFGFHEVLTPTMYKEALWKQSGHWANYKDDMFTVTGSAPRKSGDQAVEFINGRMQPKISTVGNQELEEYGLKPMNCPGHCLLYNCERRSYRDLPIRYAEFSPLHRNEISGALSGLTRVRRFHQDDGHIFCRPSQIGPEIEKCLQFIRLVYETLGLPEYSFVLSTRPEKDYIGTKEEWKGAEDQLAAALDGSFIERWRTAEGEGAFYGPKIDVIVQDRDGKGHQTGTIQLDFQLPKRFELTYESPAPDMEAKGENWEESGSRSTLGKATPVMIHRAILGSLERFMALLLEHYKGQLPFWLSPNQVVILTVSDKPHIASYAEEVRWQLLTTGDASLPLSLAPLTCAVDIDKSADTVAQKIVRAKKKNYNIICIVGERNVSGAKSGHGNTVDLDISAQPDQVKAWTIIETIKPGSQAPVQKDKGSGPSFRGLPGVRLSIRQCRMLVEQLTQAYC